MAENLNQPGPIEPPKLPPSTPLVEEYRGGKWVNLHRYDWPKGMSQVILDAEAKPGELFHWTGVTTNPPTNYRVTWSVGPKRNPMAAGELADALQVLTGNLKPGLKAPDFWQSAQEKTKGAEGPLPAGGLEDGPDVAATLKPPGVSLPPSLVLRRWVARGEKMRDGKGPRWVDVEAPYTPEVSAAIVSGRLAVGAGSVWLTDAYYQIVDTGRREDQDPPTVRLAKAEPTAGRITRDEGEKFMRDLFRDDCAIACLPAFVAIANSGTPNQTNEELSQWAAEMAYMAADAMAKARNAKPKRFRVEIMRDEAEGWKEVHADDFENLPNKVLETLNAHRTGEIEYSYGKYRVTEAK